MSFIDNQLELAAADVVVLKYTKKITKEDKKLPKWLFCAEEYKDKRPSFEKRVIVAMLNSCFFQDRLVFLLTKRSLSDLVRSDRNWDKEYGFDNTKFKDIVRALDKSMMFKRIVAGKKGKADVWEVTHPNIIRLLSVNLEDQRRTTIEYYNDYAPTAHKTAQLPAHESEPEGEDERGRDRSHRVPNPSPTNKNLMPSSPETYASVPARSVVDREMEEWLKKANDPFNLKKDN